MIIPKFYKKDRLGLYLILWLLFLSSSITFGQDKMIEGYVYESNNRGYLNLVEIKIKDKIKGQIFPLIYSELDGSFKATLPANKEYSLMAFKDLFVEKVLDFNTTDQDKIFLKVELQRKPGYVFDMTIANNRKDPNQTVDAIMNADIDIYNNTTRKVEAAWIAHHEPHFKYTFEKGNHYTLLIRKTGFLAKRVEIFVNVNGCILCVDGLGELRPEVTDNLTSGHEMGTLLANIVMDSVNVNKTFTFKNIYYESNKSDIASKAAKELLKVADLLKQNPELILELGSHTDARGFDQANMELSEKRARAAVDYLIKNGEIEPASLSARGYGESKIVNKCLNRITCSDQEHAVNRRTELKVIGILTSNQFKRKSLEQIKQEEYTEQLIKDLQEQKSYQVKDTLSNTDSATNGLFTGIRIELLISETLLNVNHDVYKIYKAIHVELPNGKHAYNTGDFNTAMDANDFMNTAKIKLKYPKARMVQFENGRAKE